MNAECKVCGKKPGSEDWAEFDYESGDFYCPDCSPTDFDEGDSEVCELCEREGVGTETHHLVPQSKDGGSEESNLAEVCTSCHRKIHATFANIELKDKYDSIEALKRSKKIRDYVKWIRRTDKRNVRFKESTRVKYKRSRR